MFDLVSFVELASYVGMFAVVFSETGLLAGFFLPGDSLLFTAGFLASQGKLDIVFVIVVSFLAAVVGDSVGYAIGFRLGPKIFTKDDSLFFHKDHVERAKRFFEKHGPKTIILARFLPVVRTVAPALAGVGSMTYSTFFAYNILGGLLWTVGLPLLGYYFGTVIPDADRYIIPIVLGIIVVSVLPELFHIASSKKHRDDVRRYVTRLLGYKN